MSPAITSSVPSFPTVYEVRDVFYGYQSDRPVLRNINLTITEGEFAALIGPNGAGKSTCLSLLSGAVIPLRGRVMLRGKPVQEWRRNAFARQVAVVPQKEYSVFDFTVHEVVLMGRYAFRRGPFGLEDQEDYEVVHQVLEETDLSHLSQRPLGCLSGGERQRVLVARALAQQTPILLLDEPTTALDPLHQKSMLDLLVRLNREHGKTIILVSHDLSLVGTFADQVIVLKDGEVVREGSTSEVIQADFLREVYHTELCIARLEDGTVLVGLHR